MQGFPGRFPPGDNGPMGMQGMPPGAVPGSQQPGLNVDLQAPFNRALLEYMFRQLVPEDKRRQALESIIFPMITSFRENCKRTKKDNSSNPHFSELVISGEFKKFVEGGVQFIHHMANEVAKMELFEVSDVRDKSEKEDKPDDGNIIVPE